MCLCILQEKEKNNMKRLQRVEQEADLLVVVHVKYTLIHTTEMVVFLSSSGCYQTGSPHITSLVL